MLKIRLFLMYLIYSFLSFVYSPITKKKKYIQIVIKKLFKNSFRYISIDDLDSYDKCNKFLEKAKRIPDKKLYEDLIIKIIHCQNIVHLSGNSVRLKRLGLYGIEYDNLIQFLSSKEPFANLRNVYFTGEGRRSLGLIKHIGDTVLYITKIIPEKEAYLKELYFYENLRYLGNLYLYSPKMVSNLEYNGVYLITLEFLENDKDYFKIPIDSILDSLKQLSFISFKQYHNYLEANEIIVPLHLIKKTNLRMMLYSNLLSILNYESLDTVQICRFVKYASKLKIDKNNLVLTHGDALSWNFRLTDGVVKVIDWESYGLGLPGIDYLDCIISNDYGIKNLKDFFLEKYKYFNNADETSLLLVFLLRITAIKNYMNKKNLTRFQQGLVFNIIIRGINEKHR